MLYEVGETLHEKFGIDHITLRIERENGGCRLADIHSVLAPKAQDALMARRFGRGFRVEGGNS